MKFSCTFLLLSVCLPVLLAGVSRPRRSLWDLKDLIDCALPSSWPVIDFADYGCYCGKGGSGTAVDQLDRCCETHDHCYGAAMALPACASILDLDNPYTYGYNYQCDHATKTITCLATNDACQMFICECDKHLAQCMSTAPYISAHDHYDQALCHQHS
ncbi:phospholipase A2-like [Clupea harengus]|uniref:Phospholipase A2 n=1 Tax=Clupea harengus TaxID=7950 RepID=A0A6P3VQV4_CLUHA|nr:phospholipase A2-like [Clupea harengus]